MRTGLRGVAWREEAGGGGRDGASRCPLGSGSGSHRDVGAGQVFLSFTMAGIPNVCPADGSDPGARNGVAGRGDCGIVAGVSPGRTGAEGAGGDSHGRPHMDHMASHPQGSAVLLTRRAEARRDPSPAEEGGAQSRSPPMQGRAAHPSPATRMCQPLETQGACLPGGKEALTGGHGMEPLEART